LNYQSESRPIKPFIDDYSSLSFNKVDSYKSVSSKYTGVNNNHN